MRTRESQSIFSESASGDRVHSPCHAIHAVLQCKRTLCASATVRTNHLVVVFSLKRFLMKSMWCAFQFYLSVFFSFLSFSMMIIIMKMLKEELYARAYYHWFGSSSYIHIYISLSLRWAENRRFSFASSSASRRLRHALIMWYFVMGV